MEACALITVKYSLVFFNSVFAISGVVLTVLGGVLMAATQSLSYFLKSRYTWLPVSILITGPLVVALGLFGCYGAIKEKVVKLHIFIFLMGFLILTHMAIGISAIVMESILVKHARQDFSKGMKNFEKSSDERSNWNSLHKTFQCCGVDGVDEWGSYVGEGNVPASCCGPHRHLILNDRNLRVCKISWNKTLLHTRGCWTVIEPLISKHSLVVMGVAIGLSLCQVLGIVLSIMLIRHLKKEQELKQITVLKVWTEREEGSRWPKSKTNEVESEEQPRATANPT